MVWNGPAAWPGAQRKFSAQTPICWRGVIKSAERVIAANSKAAMQWHPFTLSGIWPNYRLH